MKNIGVNVLLVFMFVLICLSPLSVFGDNSTNISLNVHEVTVDAGNHAVYVIDGVKYKGERTFYFASLDDIEIECLTDLGYKIKSITCESSDIVLLLSNSVKIEDITSDANIKFVVRKKSSGSSGGSSIIEDKISEDESKPTDETKTVDDYKPTDETKSNDEGNNEDIISTKPIEINPSPDREEERESNENNEDKKYIDDHPDFEDYIIDPTEESIIEPTKGDENQSSNEEDLEFIPTEEIKSEDIEKRIDDIDNDNLEIYDYGDGQVIITSLDNDNIDINILDEKKDIIKNILDAEELELVQNGETIELRVQIEKYDTNSDLNSIISKDVLEKSNTILDDSYDKLYLEVKLYKIIGLNNITNLLNIDSDIELLITIPLSDYGVKQSENYIMYSIDSDIHELSDLDDSDDTITIKTSNFPTYIVVYMKDDNGISEGHCTCFIHWIVLILSIINICLHYKLKVDSDEEDSDDEDIDEDKKDKKKNNIRSILTKLLYIIVVLLSLLAIYIYRCYYDIIITVIGFILCYIIFNLFVDKDDDEKDEDDEVEDK